MTITESIQRLSFAPRLSRFAGENSNYNQHWELNQWHLFLQNLFSCSSSSAIFPLSLKPRKKYALKANELFQYPNNWVVEIVYKTTRTPLGVCQSTKNLQPKLFATYFSHRKGERESNLPGKKLGYFFYPGGTSRLVAATTAIPIPGIVSQHILCALFAHYYGP